MSLRAKKKYFEQVLHIVSYFCGKPVDSVFAVIFAVVLAMDSQLLLNLNGQLFLQAVRVDCHGARICFVNVAM